MKKKQRTDTERLDWILEWLGHHDDVQELPVRDWENNTDARAAIDDAMDAAPLKDGPR